VADVQRRGAAVRTLAGGLAALAVAVSGLGAAGCATTAGTAPASPVVAVSGAAGFERLVRTARNPVLVVFHSPGCHYCRACLQSQVPKLARDFAGALDLVTVNTWEAPELASRHGVRGVPVLVFFAHGAEVKRLSGYRPYFMVKRSVRAVLRDAALPRLGQVSPPTAYGHVAAAWSGGPGMGDGETHGRTCSGESESEHGTERARAYGRCSFTPVSAGAGEVVAEVSEASRR
jgi:thiol-disulfide isomerase/thioredoxin